MRASDSDREVIVDRLRKAAGEGRLAAHELEERVGAALRASTYGELDATVADLPGRLAPRSRSHSVVATARAHPALLLAAIPVVLVTVVLVAAISIAWLACMTALFVLGRRHRIVVGAGPWGAWRGYGPHQPPRGRAGYGA